MNASSSGREVWVGLAVIVAIAGLLGLVAMASDGPGFLAAQRTLDVVFRDAQGVRVGSPVRIAGLDTGNVVDTDFAEVDGALRARVRISLPASLVKKMRQDVKIAIQPALTGMSHVNIISTGRMGVPLVPGQPIAGVETSFFDPVLEQVGLGPVERNHLSHTIAEVRQTVDAIAPRLRESLGSIQETAANLREMGDAIRPAVESTVGHVEDVTRRLSANGPRMERALGSLESLSGEAQALLGENRENLQHTLARVRDLTTSLNDVVSKDRIKVERLLDGLDVSRARADRVLYQLDQISGQSANMLARSRADIERSVANVRDATDWVNKLAQKIFTNPYMLSPFFKPSHEDLRVQGVYDTALVFTKGAQELHDTIKTLEILLARPTSPELQREIAEILQTVRIQKEQLGETSARLADGLKRPTNGGRALMR
jgi:phospholipid/cholesterol/gamma-HCH transport system substrate-binding protein